MTNRTFAREWTCRSCGQVNTVLEQDGFMELCSVLLAGESGVIICRQCGRAEGVRFTGSVLELVD